MIKEIKNINKKSLAKIAALFYGLIGFIMALAIAVSTMINIIIQKDFQGSFTLVALFNLGAGLLFGVLTALLTACCGWVVGYIAAWIYNWFTKKVGGIKIDMEDAAENFQTRTKDEADTAPVETNTDSQTNQPLI